MPNMSKPPSSGPKSSDETTMSPPQALKAAKNELRTLMKAKLSQIPKPALESQSKAAFQALLGLRQYREAKKISIYLSMPTGEIQTDEIVRHALSAGKDVFVPYLHRNVQAEASSREAGSGTPKKVMDMVRLQGLGDYEGLERDAWGIPTVTEEGVEGRERVLGEVEEGGGKERRASLDLMLMPGVAFEEEEEGGRCMVRRLGHGKGFYDFFLHRYRSNGENNGNETGFRMALFGLALKEQFLQDEQELHVPTGPYDSLLDGLVVGDGHIIESAPI